MQLILAIRGPWGPKIGRNIIPMANNFRNVRIVIGSAKIGNGTVVIESEISGASARDVSDETGPTFGLVVAVQFSGLQRALGPLVSGLEGGL